MDNMLRNCSLLAILLISQLSRSAGDGEFSFKTLQGEPSEFMNFSVPLKDREEISNALQLPVVYLSAGLDWKYLFPVDPVDSIVLSVVYGRVEMTGLTVTAVLTAPDGSQPKPDYYEVMPFSLIDDTSDAENLEVQFLYPKPGKWQLVLSIEGPATPKPVKALVWIAFNNSRACITAYTGSMDHLVGKDMDMNMMVPDPERKALDGSSIPLPNMMRNATMTVTYPDGKEEVHVMYKEKTPGMMGGKFRPPIAGNYTVELEVTGVDDESGYEFARSLTQTLSVVSPSLNVTGSISNDLYHHPVTGNEIILIQVGVKWDPQSKDTYRGYAEVYGTGEGGVSVPVAWVGGLIQVKQTGSNSYMLQFELDSRWLILANATFPLTLHNLTFEEIDWFIEVVKVPQFMKVSNGSPLIAQWRPMMEASEVDITYEMRNGYSSYRGKAYGSDAESAVAGGDILLVHGYCADRQPFPAEHFTNPVEFSDLRRNRPIDEFARLVISFTRSLGLQRFSIVSHSQGGMVAVHMLTFYNTPLDGMVGHGRVIQSVGTPYSGTPLAGGFLPTLGGILGIVCGSISDLTVEGALRWQREIPPSVQREVFYYTTQGGRGLFGIPRPCSRIASLILSSPNDGVVELKGARLPFGTHVSDSMEECHVRLVFNWPAQTINKQRNEEMDRLAAR